MRVRGRRRKHAQTVLMALLFAMSSLVGCTSIAGVGVVDPQAEMRAYPEEIESGESVTFDARDSDPIEGVITEFRWNFGDETTSETIVGSRKRSCSSKGGK